MTRADWLIVLVPLAVVLGACLAVLNPELLQLLVLGTISLVALRNLLTQDRR